MHARLPPGEQLRVCQVQHGADVVQTQAARAAGHVFLHGPGRRRAGKAPDGGVRQGGELRGGEPGLLRDVQPAHHDGDAGRKYDLRRVRVGVDVEFRAGRAVAAHGRAAHEGDAAQQGPEGRVGRQRDGRVCQRAGRHERQLAGHTRRRLIQGVPCGRLLRGAARGGEHGSAEAVGPVEAAGVLALTAQRAGSAGVNGVVRAHKAADFQGIFRRVVECDVARHGAQPDDLQPGLAVGRQQGDGVVHAGVAVKPDPMFSHRYAPPPSEVPRSPRGRCP